MPALNFAGHDFCVVDRTALYWPVHNALIVADLHLEKASWFAARGQMLPPHDSLATLERLAAVIARTGATTIWCLGDNFHDDDGAHRIAGRAAALLGELTARLDWQWIVGNHDAALPDHIGGRILAEVETNGLVLRHAADPAELRPELTGHYHPKYRAQGARGGVTRACFVTGATKLILPAFGVFTGGLHATDPAIRKIIGKNAWAHIAAQDRLLRFPL